MTAQNAYRTIWRWHFYAGLFCIPFVILLSITGSIYLFKPQIEAWLDQPYDQLALSGQRASAADQVKAALAAIPGANLHSYELPRTSQSAVQILLGKGVEEYRVYVNPETLAIVNTVREDYRPMKILFRLHGELLLGDTGSAVVELAASWAVVMIVTGLYLWWPRRSQGLGGIVYPRLRQGGRVFWRDLHAVTALWISGLVLFMLISGLPWSKQWGGDLRFLRGLMGASVQQQDWTTGRSSELARRQSMDSDGAAMGHSGHGGMMAMLPDTPDAFAPLDRVLGPVAALNLAPPVLIVPPNRRSPQWTARGEAQNRILRTNLVLDGATGTIVSRKDFSQNPLLDQVIGVGIAAHEGQLFGVLNQILGVLTAAGLIIVSVSAVTMWWRRKPDDALGAPAPLAGAGIPLGLGLLIVILGFLLPLLGLSIILVGLTERFILCRIRPIRDWLGLSAPMDRYFGIAP